MTPRLCSFLVENWIPEVFCGTNYVVPACFCVSSWGLVSFHSKHLQISINGYTVCKFLLDQKYTNMLVSTLMTLSSLLTEPHVCTLILVCIGHIYYLDLS